MDPATFEVQCLFYQGAYAACIEKGRVAAPGDAGDSSRLYAARAAAATGDWAAARSFTGSGAAFAAVGLLVDALEALENGAEPDSILVALGALVNDSDSADTAVVRYCHCLATFLAGDSENALQIVGVDGSGSSQELENVALGVHILLAINRIDLAEKEYLAARQWGEDALLVQLMEAWIALARGGRATQQAYYVYDELSQTTNIANTPGVVPTLVGKAVASAALGDYAQGNGTISAAQALDSDAHTAANAAVLSALDPAGNAEPTRVASLAHPIAADWATKRAELSEAVASFA